MKCITWLLLLITSLQAFAVPTAAVSRHKISHIEGIILPDTTQRYYEETSATLDIPGPRTIYIDSLGGALDSGQNIIDMMEVEKAHGVRMVCIVKGEATSMAFNILTHCDARYATRKSRFLVHKAAIGAWDPTLRGTAKNLRKEANELERADEPYRQANCAAMHLTLAEYDDNADQERTWTADELVRSGYLNGYAQ